MFKYLFLPGAGGSGCYWKPGAIEAQLDGVFFAWLGLGEEPPAEGANSIDDLVGLAARVMTEPVNVITQSMGGIIAIRLALALPKLVRNLVLAVTSVGVPVADLGGSDWRPLFRYIPERCQVNCRSCHRFISGNLFH